MTDRELPVRCCFTLLVLWSGSSMRDFCSAATGGTAPGRRDQGSRRGHTHTHPHTPARFVTLAQIRSQQSPQIAPVRFVSLSTSQKVYDRTQLCHRPSRWWTCCRSRREIPDQRQEKEMLCSRGRDITAQEKPPRTHLSSAGAMVDISVRSHDC